MFEINSKNFLTSRVHKLSLSDFNQITFESRIKTKIFKYKRIFSIIIILVFMYSKANVC